MRTRVLRNERGEKTNDRTKIKGRGRNLRNSDIVQVGLPTDPEVTTNPTGNDNDYEGSIGAEQPFGTVILRTSTGEDSSEPAQSSRDAGSSSRRGEGSRSEVSSSGGKKGKRRKFGLMGKFSRLRAKDSDDDFLTPDEVTTEPTGDYDYSSARSSCGYQISFLLVLSSSQRNPRKH